MTNELFEEERAAAIHRQIAVFESQGLDVPKFLTGLAKDLKPKKAAPAKPAPKAEAAPAKEEPAPEPVKEEAAPAVAEEPKAEAPAPRTATRR